jgi:hypothetical protein
MPGRSRGQQDVLVHNTFEYSKRAPATRWTKVTWNFQWKHVRLLLDHARRKTARTVAPVAVGQVCWVRWECSHVSCREQ